jgi:exodeoxyribonuclease X
LKISEAHIVVIDTESTGFDPAPPDNHRLLEIGAVCADDEYQSYINPERDIPPDASGVHNITKHTVATARFEHEVIEDFYDWIMELKHDAPWADGGNEHVNLLAAHNAAHDRKFLPKLEGFKWLCSYELAKRVWPDAPNYKANTLRYYLAEAVDAGRAIYIGDGLLHSALYDARIAEYVLQETIAGYLAQGGVDDVDAIIEYSQKPYRLKKLWFGKHKDQPIDTVPTDYIKWWMRQERKDGDRDLVFTFEQILAERSGMFTF